MTYSIAIRKAAEDDLAQVRDWYDANRPGLGLEFLTEIDSVLERISLDPLNYPVMYRVIRRALVHRFPYKL